MAGIIKQGIYLSKTQDVSGVDISNNHYLVYVDGDDKFWAQDSNQVKIRLDNTDLESQVSSLSAALGVSYRGFVTCPTSSQLIHIDLTSFGINGNDVVPHTTIIVPTSADVLYVDSITNRTSNGFDVVLSSIPDVTGYQVYWSITSPATSGVYSTGLDLLNVPTSIVPSTSAYYDLGSIDKPWRSLYVTENTVFFDGVPLSVNKVQRDVSVDGVSLLGRMTKLPPKILGVDSGTGTIYFEDVPEGLQIEVFKYINTQRGDHHHRNGKIYPNHAGKRFKPFMMLKKGQKEWTIPARLIVPWRRKYFKFCYYYETEKIRGNLTMETLCTPSDIELYGQSKPDGQTWGGGCKIRYK